MGEEGRWGWRWRIELDGVGLRFFAKMGWKLGI